MVATQHVSVRTFPRPLWRRFKASALLRGDSLKDALIRAVELYIREEAPG